MNEFSQLLHITQDLMATVEAQQLQINGMREQIAALSEAIQGQPPEQKLKDQEAA
ncbi:hypothetical protein P3339_09405 [Microbulbifer sp. MLAF003]|uniref:hypothetical protein n=1 Tax=unclassified Microbulbifer TaxID=2619833 RepID=UPI0024AE343A|nr:hypothetical protein [Microbulbifer sp. MLAF003]WHI52957.1 hypothetical protein P3339_09405 [Microbulbifer sp. MLAF003]